MPAYSLYTLRTQRSLICLVLSVLLLASLAYIVPSKASNPQPQTLEEYCGQRIENYTYDVPYGNSPWNIPTCELDYFNGSEAQAKDYGRRLYEYGTMWNAGGDFANEAAIAKQKGKFQTQFGLADASADYSTAIYYADANTPKKQIMVCEDYGCHPSNLDKAGCWDTGDIDCMAPLTPIPWDPKWVPSGGSDSEVIIFDKSTKRVYSVGRINFGGTLCVGMRNIWYNLAGRDTGNRLCVGGVSLLRYSTGAIANYETYSQGVTSERGLGIQNSAMIVTPEEIAAGEIRHALTMEAVNTMSGPRCTPEQHATNDPNIVGKQCGYALSPATMFEWYDARDVSRAVPNRGSEGSCVGAANKIADPATGKTFAQLYTLDKMVPEGMRFKLTWTDAQIDAWLDTKAQTDPGFARGQTKRNTTRIMAIALKDYGWIVGDTTCYGAGFTMSGSANPETKAKWAQLGIKDSSSQMLLDGLFTKDNIIAVQAPVSTCHDGKNTKTSLDCPWLTSNYYANGDTSQALTLPNKIRVTTTTQPPNIEPATSMVTTTAPTPTTATSKPDFLTTQTQPESTTPPTTRIPSVQAHGGGKVTVEPSTTTTTTTLPLPKIVVTPTPANTTVKITDINLGYDGFGCSWRTSCRIVTNYSVQGGAIDKYVITRKSSDNKTVTFDAPPNSNKFTDYKVSPRNTYTYTIQAIRSEQVVSTATITRRIECFLGIICSLTY